MHFPHHLMPKSVVEVALRNQHAQVHQELSENQAALVFELVTSLVIPLLLKKAPSTKKVHSNYPLSLDLFKS